MKKDIVKGKTDYAKHIANTLHLDAKLDGLSITELDAFIVEHIDEYKLAEKIDAYTCYYNFKKGVKL